MEHENVRLYRLITAATGRVTKVLRKNLEVTPGKHSTDALHKTAVLGTSNTVQKVLQCAT